MKAPSVIIRTADGTCYEQYPTCIRPIPSYKAEGFLDWEPYEGEELIRR
jgi:hypothetical protein